MKMKIFIKDVTVITLTEKPYEYQGKSGVSYKADILVDGSVEKFKLTEEAYQKLKIGFEGTLQAELFMRDSFSSLKVVGVAD